MNTPIQSAPIDRANRALNARSAGADGGLRPSDLGSAACAACELIPFPIGKIICRAIACEGGLLGR